MQHPCKVGLYFGWNTALSCGVVTPLLETAITQQPHPYMGVAMTGHHDPAAMKDAANPST